MLSTLFARRPEAQDTATWTPDGTIVVQRYRGAVGERETSASRPASPSPSPSPHPPRPDVRSPPAASPSQTWTAIS
ncbi:hypothetical protein ACFWBB_42370, partial [Streptomyces sp. NPDC060000]